MKKTLTIGGLSGTLVAAIPLISKFIIRDTISLNTQLCILLGILFIIAAIPAGVFYLRSKDLVKNIQELKQEHKDNLIILETKTQELKEEHKTSIKDIEANYKDVILKLEEKIEELENNRDAVISSLENKKYENISLRAQLTLYAYGLAPETRLRLEEAATLHLGGTNHGHQSSQNNQ